MKVLQYILSIFLFIIIYNPVVLAFSWNSKISEANKFYSEKNYQKAFESFKQAQIDEPNNEKLKFNLGNTAYKLGKFDDAVNTFKSLSEQSNSPILKEKSFYNLGNSYYKQGKLEEAEKSYLDALKIDNNDLQAKKNLEKVREEIKKHKKQEQERKKNQKNKNDDKKPDKEKKPDQNKKQDEGNQKQQKEPPKGGKDKNNKNNQGNKNGGKQKPELSQEEADKWLNAVKDKSDEVLKRQALKKVPQGYYSDKDW